MKKRRPKVVVVGSINMDLVLSCEHLPRPGETLAASRCAEISGGKGANQAVAAARMGSDVELVGRVGNDVFGPQLLKRLQESGVGIEQVKICDDCGSGLAVVMVEVSGQNSIVIVPGANGQLSPADIRLASSRIQAADLLIVQLEVPLDTIAEALLIAKESKVKVVLNPAPACSALPTAFYQVDIMCPNQTEAELLTGVVVDGYESAQRAATELMSRGVSQVVITLGKDGACVGERTESGVRFTHIASISVEVVDTTAAGDAFIGALATYVSEYQELRDASRNACIAGALATTKWGAQPSLPWRAEVEAKLRAVASNLS
jgi:ribokinase